MRTEVFLAGDLARAEFVQVVQGRVSALDRAWELLPALQEALKAHLPALLGTVSVELGAGRFTRALYFSTEEQARAAELEMPPEILARDQEGRQFVAWDRSSYWTCGSRGCTRRAEPVRHRIRCDLGGGPP